MNHDHHDTNSTTVRALRRRSAARVATAALLISGAWQMPACHLCDEGPAGAGATSTTTGGAGAGGAGGAGAGCGGDGGAITSTGAGGGGGEAGECSDVCRTGKCEGDGFCEAEPCCATPGACVCYAPDEPLSLRCCASECGRGFPGKLFVTRPASQPPPSPWTGLDLYPSNGDGTFGAPMFIDFGEEITGIVIDDFDNDGSLEINAWGRATGAHYRADYCSTAGQWTLSTLPDPVPAPFDVNLFGYGDLNGDGLTDVFGWTFTFPRVGYTALQNAGGTFTLLPGTFNPEPGPGTAYHLNTAVHARDVDGDGRADLILEKFDTGGASPTSVYLLRGAGPAGYFDPPQFVATLRAPANAADLADIDGDGDVDLLTGLDDDGDPGQCWLLDNSGTALGGPVPSIDPFPLLESGSDGPGYGFITLYDWDNDTLGLPDALVGSTTQPAGAAPQIQIYRGNGASAFQPPATVVANTTSIWTAVPAR
jgi:hypothetical protein